MKKYVLITLFALLLSPLFVGAANHDTSDTSGTTSDTSGTTSDTSGTTSDTSGTTSDTSGTTSDTSGTTSDTSGTTSDTSGTSGATSGTSGGTSAPCAEGEFCNPLGATTSLAGFITKLINSVVIPVGTVAVVLALIYSGFLFVTAQGSDDKITKAKTAFFWTVVGGLVLLGSGAIATGVQGTICAIGDVPGLECDP